MFPIPNYYVHEGKDPVASAIVWMRKRRIGKAFFLAIASVFILTVAWRLFPPHSALRAMVVATYLPGIAVNRLLASLLAKVGIAESRQFHALAVLVFVFMTHVMFWYAVLGAIRKRPAETSAFEEQQSATPETLVREG